MQKLELDLRRVRGQLEEVVTRFDKMSKSQIHDGVTRVLDNLDDIITKVGGSAPKNGAKRRPHESP